MNIDLGSPALDIAVGLSFIFFLLSVIASAVSEAIAGALNLRGRTLLSGIKGLIGDEQLAEKVFDHPLVRTNGLKKKTKQQREVARKAKAKGPLTKLWGWLKVPFVWLHNFERKPSYVAAKNFAAAFLDEKSKQDATSTPTTPKFYETQLDALGSYVTLTEQKDLKKVEDWFNDGMERVSGWYKRRSQWVTLLVAIAVAVGLNANTLRIANVLEHEPATRQAVLSAAEKSLTPATPAEETKAEKEEAKKKKDEGKETPQATEEIEKAGKHLSEATSELKALNLPIFWSKANSLHSIPWWENGLGWLITVVAISLGAPFWFDALGKLSNLRLAGKNPEEKEKGKG